MPKWHFRARSHKMPNRQVLSVHKNCLSPSVLIKERCVVLAISDTCFISKNYSSGQMSSVSGSVCRRSYLSFPHHVAGGKICVNAVTFSSGKIIQV